MARAIGRALAEAGWPVVSGLAEGIDAEAHQGCLEAGGRPVGVLGTPLSRVYPRHHHQLQAAVGEQGLLVSELAQGTPGRPGHFALRNRLQVGLAKALVLVESSSVTIPKPVAKKAEVSKVHTLYAGSEDMWYLDSKHHGPKAVFRRTDEDQVRQREEAKRRVAEELEAAGGNLWHTHNKHAPPPPK